MITLTAKIYINETEVIDIDRRNLIGISSSIFDRSDLKLPSFGIISNKGNIEFNDTDGRVLQYSEDLLLQAGLKCEIWLNNTLIDGASKMIGSLETDQWDYDNDSREVSVSVKDDLEEWQNIYVGEIAFNPIKESAKSFKWFYEILWSLTPLKHNMLNFNELDNTTKSILTNSYVKYPFLKSCSLWAAWKKLCEVCQLHIYKDNGVVICRYNGGN